MLDMAVGVAILFGLGLFFATLLALAHKKFKVIEDPRIDRVEELLPGANCGACGSPGCRAFAEMVVAGEARPGQCTVSPNEQVEAIADLLGVEMGTEEKRVARLLCAGGKNEAHQQAIYSGEATCRAVTMVSAGSKGCIWGCLGHGDCAEACTFDAITMNDDRLPVVNIDRCTACGDCVITCPKDLFMLLPLRQKLLVQCRSLLAGDEAEALCSVACTACGRCALDAEEGLITMQNNLPVIHADRIEHQSRAAIQRCPTGAIVWVEGMQFRRTKEAPLPLGRVGVRREEE
jgi:H+/Na+-translocating ferredoxin:NAD+ oxidoreductase subunit B